MAYKNKTIRNPKTQTTITFLQTANDTGGQLLEMEHTYNGHSTEPAPHYHPNQEEEFTVLSGELSVRIDGQVRVLKQGERLHIPKNKIHSMWNNSAEKTVVNWKVQPAMDTECFLETAAGLANDGKTNGAGMPGLLQVALLANRFSAVFRLSKPPFPIQRVLFGILMPVAYLAGYRPVYKKYLD